MLDTTDFMDTTAINNDDIILLTSMLRQKINIKRDKGVLKSIYSEIRAPFSRN